MWEPSNVVLSGLETQPEPGAPPGGNGSGPFMGVVMGSRDVQPALEFAEVRNWDGSELEVRAGLRRQLLACQRQHFRTGSPPLLDGAGDCFRTVCNPMQLGFCNGLYVSGSSDTHRLKSQPHDVVVLGGEGLWEVIRPEGWKPHE